MSEESWSSWLRVEPSAVAQGEGLCRVAHFGDKGAEYLALRAGAGLIPLQGLATVRLTGKDRVRYLHGLITNDVQKLKGGQGCYATLITAQGRTLSDLHVLCFDDHLLLTFPASSRERVLQHLDFYLIADKAEIEDVSDAWAWISVQGPGAPGVLGEGPLPLEASSHLGLELAGQGALAVRVDRSGFGGFDVGVSPEGLAALWGELRARGGTPVGAHAWDIARVEAGLPWTGRELTEEVIPMEAGLEHSAVSFSKGCYLGQEVLAKIKYRGKVQRNLRVLHLPELAQVGGRLWQEGEDAGWITSVVDSPRLGRVGLGFVKARAEEKGLPLTTDGGGAEIIPLEGAASGREGV